VNFQKQQKPTVKVGVVDATKHYVTRTGVIHALEGVSFDVREGELVCVLGPRDAARRLCCGRWPACIRSPAGRC